MNYEAETRDLLETLLREGFTITSGNNGGEENFAFTTVAKFLPELMASDEAWLYVQPPTAENSPYSIYLVFGNSPGELVADYHVHPLLDEVLTAFAERWEAKR